MSQNHKVAILSRGYKRKIPNPNTTKSQVNPKSQIPNYETMGDEPYMLAKKLDIPVIVDPDRIKAAHQAIRDYKVDTVILDDGFQQWRIKKDLEIATLDATDPFGNRHLLPRGILREPLSGLRRADVIVFTKTNLNPDIQDIKDFLSENKWQAETFDSIHSPASFYRLENPDVLLNPDSLRGKTVTLFSGIGDPDSFENLIISLGINVGLALRFPDHHSYSSDDLEKIFKSSQEKNINTIITTEKDAVRLNNAQRTAHNAELLVLRIALKITQDEERFRNRLLRLYSR
jgi:tetraacyldisaccharide 4'-kinase